MRDIKYIEKEKVSMLIKQKMNERDRLIIKLFFITFCRSNELRNIKVSDIKFGRCHINIRAENTKTNISRIAVVPRKIMTELKNWLIKNGRDVSFQNNEYLFNSRQSERLTNKRIRQIVTEYANKIGINDVYAESKDGRRLNSITPHTLRHSAIIEALNRGIPQTAVMEQSGHRSLSAFQIYSRFSVEDRKRIFKEKGFKI
jgi:integrase